MNQGAKRHALAERGRDTYQTPTCATETLLRVERLPHRIWEPCAGLGAIARVLEAADHSVVAQDIEHYDGADPRIETGVDFFRTRTAPPGFDCIVTNPPFMHADQFVRHALTLVPTVIVLLRLMALEGARRSDIIDSHLVRVWVGKERLPMMHREGWQGKRIGNSGAPFAWFVFRSGGNYGEPIALRRMSWRGE
jgi:hypothetical protein